MGLVALDETKMKCVGVSGMVFMVWDGNRGGFLLRCDTH